MSVIIRKIEELLKKFISFIKKKEWWNGNTKTTIKRRNKTNPRQEKFREHSKEEKRVAIKEEKY